LQSFEITRKHYSEAVCTLLLRTASAVIAVTCSATSPGPSDTWECPHTDFTSPARFALLATDESNAEFLFPKTLHNLVQILSFADIHCLFFKLILSYSTNKQLVCLAMYMQHVQVNYFVLSAFRKFGRLVKRLKDDSYFLIYLYTYRQTFDICRC